MKNLIFFILLFINLPFAKKVHCQLQNDLAENEVIAQVSFIYPLSTNGYMAGKYTNRLSINLISGYAYALNGVEFGGFANILKDSMYGVQIAGFGNVVGGSSNGLQAAGFFNVARKDIKGVQLAGFSNIAADSAYALQVAGFTNTCRGKMQGAQVAGFSNLCLSNLEGGQIAGFVNTTKGNLIGVQLAGFANITTADIEGYQVSGFFNKAKKVNGSQIGFINLSDSIENGIPIGFFSFVKKGYKRLALGGNEVFYGQAQFKTGSRIFHNIFSFGITPTATDFAIGYGYGLGTGFNISDKWSAEINGTVHHILDKKIWDYKLNLLSRINMNVEYSINKHLGLYGGPSINFHVNDIYDYYGDGPSYTQVAPEWSFYSDSDGFTEYNMWFGFNVGVNLY